MMDYLQQIRACAAQYQFGNLDERLDWLDKVALLIRGFGCKVCASYKDLYSPTLILDNLRQYEQDAQTVLRCEDAETLVKFLTEKTYIERKIDDSVSKSEEDR